MAGKEKRATQRAPVVLRIKLRYRDVDTFIDRFATNIGTGGMFIASRAPKPTGTKLKFALMLADESSLVAGTGVVRWVRAYDPDQPRRPHGMGIEFLELEPQSQSIIDRVVQHRADRGLDTDAIPLAESASRASAPLPRTATAPLVDSGPVAASPGPASLASKADLPATRQPQRSVTAPGTGPAGPAPSVPTPATAMPEPTPPPSYEDAGLDELLAGHEAPDLDRTMARARQLLQDGPPGDADALLTDLPARATAPAGQNGTREAGRAPAASVGNAPGAGEITGDGDDLGGFDDYGDEPTNVDGVALIDPDMGSADPAPGSEEAKR